MRVILAILEKPVPMIEDVMPELPPAITAVVQGALLKDRIARGKDLLGFRRRLRWALEEEEEEPEDLAETMIQVRSGEIALPPEPRAGSRALQTLPTLVTAEPAAPLGAGRLRWLALAGALLTVGLVLVALLALYPS